jgi:hypothetical protein
VIITARILGRPSFRSREEIGANAKVNKTAMARGRSTSLAKYKMAMTARTLANAGMRDGEDGEIE